MRNVILQIDVTLDGFIADLNGDIGWVTAADDMNQDASDLLSTVDTILLGRVAYQEMAKYWPFAASNGSTIVSKITHQLNHATKIVFSKTLNHVEWGQWNNAQLIQGNIADAIASMKALPGENLLLYGGVAIVSTFMRLDLIDEYRLRIHPTILGSGFPLFKDIGAALPLKLVQAKSYQNGAVLLNYVTR